MLPLLTRTQARDADRHAIETLGVPGVVLMENAGRGAFEVLRAAHSDALSRVVLVGGPGQNGGDAWVIARHLARVGHAPCAVLVVDGADASRLRGDAAINWAALRPLGVTTHVLAPEHEAPLVALLGEASLVVDGVFGTGLARPVEGAYAAVLAAINAAPAPVVALDLPSGVDADTGQVLGTAVWATTTVTFGAYKRGLLQTPARAHAGALHLADIGVRVGDSARAQLLERTDLARWVPRRAHAAHKGTAGHVVVVGGAAGKTGAAYLAGLGAQRGGAGLVTLVAPDAGRAVLEHKVVEMMTGPWPADADAWAELVAQKDALVVGPGLGFASSADVLVRGWLARVAVAAVLDADGLTLIAQHGTEGLSALREHASARVLTPHPGEAARLLGVTTSAVQADRHGAAQRIAELAGQVTVLKGAGTVIAAPDGRARVCPFGTPAMGSGGTGDVLAGLTGALLASGLDPFDAASAAVLAHALAGERTARGRDRGLLASELAHELPAVFGDAWNS